MQNPKFNEPKHRRHGFALIETVGLISIVGMLLSLCAVVLNQSFRIHQLALVEFRQLEQLNLWADRFAADARQAIAVELNQGVTFHRVGGDSVSYVVQNHRLVRFANAGKQLTSQEAWQAASIADAQWELDFTGRLPLVSCRIEFQSQPRKFDPACWCSRVGSPARPAADARLQLDANQSGKQR